MRKLVLSNQAASRSLSFDVVATNTIASILAAKPIELFVQEANAVTVALDDAEFSVTLAGPFVYPGDPVYTDLGRVVKTGDFAIRDTDPLPSVTPFAKAKVWLTDPTTGEPVIINGKELVGFMHVDTSNANATSVKLYVDNENGTFTAATIPAGVTSLVYEYRHRFNFDEIQPDAFIERKFFRGAIDIDEMNHLNQLRADLYGPGYNWNGTGAGVLPTSLLEQFNDHLSDATDAHDATAISVDGTNGLQPNVQLALEQLKSMIETNSGNNTALQAEVDAIESSVGLNTDGTMNPLTGGAGTILDNDDTIREAVMKLDAANAARVSAISDLQDEVDAIETAAGLNADGTFDAHTGTNYIDTATSMKEVDAMLDTALKAEETARQAADSAIQAELDATQVGAGLGTGGGYTADVTANYIDGATSLFNADQLLDDALKAEETARLAADAALQAELDALETATGMNANGSFSAYTGTNYIDAATSMKNADVLLDAAIDSVSDSLAAHLADTDDAHDASAISVVPGGSMNSTNVQAALEEVFGDVDALTEAVDTANDQFTTWMGNLEYNTGVEKETRGVNYSNNNYITDLDAVGGTGHDHTEALGVLDGALKTEETARLAGDAGLQAELDATQAGAGLNASGTYTANGAANYIDTATSLKNADDLLDAALKAEETARLAADAAIQAELDALEAATGMNANGSFSAYTGTNYIDAATSMKNADVLLDTAVKQVADDLAAHIADASDAHDASAISVADVAGNYTGADVEAVLAEIYTMIQSGGAANTALQTEVDNIEAGLGFNANGTMNAFSGTNYIDNDTVVEALLDLDAAVKAVADDLAQEILDRAADVDAEETRALAAEAALLAAINAIKAAHGVPVDAEIVTFAGDGYLLANEVLPGTYPMLIINGAVQTPGDEADLGVNPDVDYAVVDDGNGAMKKILLASGHGITGSDDAVVWYRKPF